MAKTVKPVLAIFAVLLLLQLACSGLADYPADQPPPGSIVIYGDCRGGHDIHRAIVEAVVKAEPKAVFNTGDLVDDSSSADQWATFDNITRGLRQMAPYYPALGNHDLPPDLFFALFELPNNERWYSMQIDGLQFVVLDTNSAIDHESDQYKWLEDQLQDMSDNFVVAVFHRPLLSTGWHGGDPDLDRILKPLFEEYDVDLVFNGHDHDYERSYRNGIYYVVTAGSGAPLRGQVAASAWSQAFENTHHFCTLSVSDGEVTVRAFTPGLRLIDEFTLDMGQHS